jgi:hypothetical protein
MRPAGGSSFQRLVGASVGESLLVGPLKLWKIAVHALILSVATRQFINTDYRRRGIGSTGALSAIGAGWTSATGHAGSGHKAMLSGVLIKAAGSARETETAALR